MDNFTDLLNVMQADNPNKTPADKSLPAPPLMNDFFGVFFKVNIKDHRFIYISPSCSCLLGFPPTYFLNGGLRSFFQLWNSSDLSIYMDKIYPNDCRFLKNYQPNSGSKLLFTFNFTCRTRQGKNISLLLKTTYLFDHQINKPVEAICWLSDIQYFKNDEAIMHVIQKIDDHSELISEPVFKATYYRNTEAYHLSRREKEIYCEIVDGLSTKEIAKKFSLSIFTINNHRKSILEKIKCKNAGELIKNALQQHFETPAKEIKIPFYKTKRILIDLSNYWLFLLLAAIKELYLQIDGGLKFSNTFCT